MFENFKTELIKAEPKKISSRLTSVRFRPPEIIEIRTNRPELSEEIKIRKPSLKFKKLREATHQVRVTTQSQDADWKGNAGWIGA